jgi:tetratricopeptide (TPR) repeat protein
MLLAAAVAAIALTGCQSRRPDQPAGETVTVARPTFSKDVAPVLFANCTPCHHQGQPVPFALLTYDDAREHAEDIADATRRRHMPPWLPEPGYGEFARERRVPAAQIEMISRWVEQGSARGNPVDLPPPPTRFDRWELGEPDLVVRLPKPYLLHPRREDVFRNFVVPAPVPATTFVRAFEFRPGNAEIVHHASIGIDRTGTSRRLDDEDPEPGYEGMLSEGLESPDGHFAGWTPGKAATVQPPDMSWPLERRADLVMQLHMLPSASATQVQPEVGLYFSDRPPTRTPFMIRLGSKAIDIPPGAKGYAIVDSYSLPVDVEALSVYPHAHYLAKEMQAFATLPDGRKQWLLWIRAWDFHHQDQYQYAKPVTLPRGTILTMRYTYDNVAGPRGAVDQPPRRVIYGPQSSDEMGDLWLQVLPRDRDARAALARDAVAREQQANLASAEMLVARDPRDARRQNLLGTRYASAGRTADGMERFREALRLDPRYGEAENNLGTALLASGQPGEAIAHFRAAVRLRPNDDRVHLNLGNALRDVGRDAEAVAELRRTIALNPDSRDGHNNLGVALAAQRKLADSVREFQRALDLDPDYADAHNNLALALNATGRRAEAIGHLRRALEIRPDYADARANLEMVMRAGSP